MNTVTSPYSATVKGRPTGLAGCPNTECLRRCLRKDAALDKAGGHGFRLDNGIRVLVPWQECGTFIPVEEI